MSTTTITLATEKVSEKEAARLVEGLKAPLVIAFSGEMGAGKTTFIRAMLRALGVTSAIKSPTFSLVETYSCALFSIHHFDLYRIYNESELETMGFSDYFTVDAICCIEWPERAPYYLQNKIDLSITLILKEQGRDMHMVGLSEAGQQVVSSLRKLS